jgi:hypothetical protein
MGGMGAAGAATGALTGEVTEATPVQGPVAMPGNLDILDENGNPATSFTTNANGEIVIEVVPTAGQTDVAITIGDETYVVDLAKSSSTSTSAMEVSYDHVNFTDKSTGFKSTATLTPDFGAVPTGPVNWSVTYVENRSSGWSTSISFRNGLTWGPVPDGPPDWWTPNDPAGSPPTGPVGQLTDIVGNRTVVVRATTNINGVDHIRDMTLEFGDGPLSLFRPAIFASIYPWASDYVPGNFNSGLTTFPAAGFCGGTVNNGSANLSSTPGVFGADWTTDTIPTTSQDSSYANNSKLPTWDQLLTIARYDATYFPDVPRKGAAYAANLVHGFHVEWWTGSIIHYDSSAVYAVAVNMELGAISVGHRVDSTMPDGVCLN